MTGAVGVRLKRVWNHWCVACFLTTRSPRRSQTLILIKVCCLFIRPTFSFHLPPPSLSHPLLSLSSHTLSDTHASSLCQPLTSPKRPWWKKKNWIKTAIQPPCAGCSGRNLLLRRVSLPQPKKLEWDLAGVMPPVKLSWAFSVYSHLSSAASMWNLWTFSRSLLIF